MSSESILKIVSKEELELLSHKDVVRFALFCAEQVREDWRGILECVRAIETVERWLEGKATAEECRKAAYAASYIAANASYIAANASYIAANAANAASYIAANAAYYENPHLIEAQWEYYEELLHFDDIAERALLGEVV